MESKGETLNMGIIKILQSLIGDWVNFIVTTKFLSHSSPSPPPPQEDPLRSSWSIMAMEKVIMRRKGRLVQISKMVSVLNLIGNIDDAIFLNQSENEI